MYLGNTTHWQRILSAESQKTAKKSFFLSIPFLVILGLLILFLGLTASVLLPGIQKETAIFSLMTGILPAGLVGVGFASILAVIMSSIDSLLVGGSTIIHRALFNKNKLHKRHKKLSKKRKLFYARLITMVFGICGFLIAFMIPNIITLSLLVAYLALIFVPPIFAGIYSKRISSNASFYAILIPTIVLFSLFFVIGKNIFIIVAILSILIILFYDKIFRKKLKKFKKNKEKKKKKDFKNKKISLFSLLFLP